MPEVVLQGQKLSAFDRRQSAAPNQNSTLGINDVTDRMRIGGVPLTFENRYAYIGTPPLTVPAGSTVSGVKLEVVGLGSETTATLDKRVQLAAMREDYRPPPPGTLAAGGRCSTSFSTPIWVWANDGTYPDPSIAEQPSDASATLLSDSVNAAEVPGIDTGDWSNGEYVTGGHISGTERSPTGFYQRIRCNRANGSFTLGALAWKLRRNGSFNIAANFWVELWPVSTFGFSGVNPEFAQPDFLNGAPVAISDTLDVNSLATAHDGVGAVFTFSGVNAITLACDSAGNQTGDTYMAVMRNDDLRGNSASPAWVLNRYWYGGQSPAKVNNHDEHLGCGAGFGYGYSLAPWDHENSYPLVFSGDSLFFFGFYAFEQPAGRGVNAFPTTGNMPIPLDGVTYAMGEGYSGLTQPMVGLVQLVQDWIDSPNYRPDYGIGLELDLMSPEIGLAYGYHSIGVNAPKLSITYAGTATNVKAPLSTLRESVNVARATLRGGSDA